MRLEAIELNTVEHLNHERDVYRKNQVILERNKKLTSNLEREIYLLETKLVKAQNLRINAE
jgi:hypothetical protein